MCLHAGRLQQKADLVPGLEPILPKLLAGQRLLSLLQVKTGQDLMLWKILVMLL